jgi:SAM-dependent methyltransferase
VDIVRPYHEFALLYDQVLGNPFFAELRRTFEWMIRRYGVRFDSVADVACGTGTFAKYLRAIGVQTVFGVDRSPEMLRRAVSKNAGNGSRFMLQDLRALRLPCPVDLLTCHFDSLNYLLTADDLHGALRRFAENLSPDGHAIFDLVTERSTEQCCDPTIERAHNRGQSIIRVTRRDPVRRLQLAQIHVCRAGSIKSETHLQRAYSIVEVVAALEGSGLQLRAVHDFHEPSKPPSLASRAVYLTRRPGLLFTVRS